MLPASTKQSPQKMAIQRRLFRASFAAGCP